MKQINNNTFNANRSHINNRTRTEAPTFGDLLRKSSWKTLWDSLRMEKGNSAHHFESSVIWERELMSSTNYPISSASTSWSWSLTSNGKRDITSLLSWLNNNSATLCEQLKKYTHIFLFFFIFLRVEIYSSKLYEAIFLGLIYGNRNTECACFKVENVVRQFNSDNNDTN